MALATTLPHAYTARYVAGWSNSPTSVASPYVITTVDFSGEPVPDAPHPAELGAGCFFAAVSRDPLCAIIEYVPNPTMLAMAYQAWFNTPLTPSADDGATPVVRTELHLDDDANVQHAVQIDYWEDYHTGNANFLHPHGDRMYTRVCDADPIHKMTFMQRGQAFTVHFMTILSAPVSLTGHLGVMRCNGDTITEGNGVTFTGVTYAQYVAQETGYYSFYIQWSTLLAVTDNKLRLKAFLNHDAGANACGSVLGHRPLPGIQDRNLLSGIRINGAALMITPDSMELAKGGRVSGAQLDTGFVVESIVKNASGAQPNTLIDNIPGSSGFDFHKGAYAFHKPRTERSYSKQVPFKHNVDYVPRAVYGSVSSAQTLCSSHSAMNVPDGWLVLGVTTPLTMGTTTSNYAGGIAHVTYSFSVEYWHYDVWIGTKLPPLGASSFDNVMQLIATAPQFHENALHVKDLKRWYNGAMPTLKAFGPGIKALLMRVAPELAPLIYALGVGASMLPDNVQ